MLTDLKHRIAVVGSLKFNQNVFQDVQNQVGFLAQAQLCHDLHYTVIFSKEGCKLVDRGKNFNASVLLCLIIK